MLRERLLTTDGLLQSDQTVSEEPRAAVLAMLERAPMEEERVVGSLVRYLADHFQQQVSEEDIYKTAMGSIVVGDWRQYVWTLVNRVRGILPQEFSFYNIHKYGRYLLDGRRQEGTWYLPADTRKSLDIWDKQNPDLVPLMEYCGEVRVEDSQRLRPRLTLQETSLLTILGSSYPFPLSQAELVRKLWNQAAVQVDTFSALRTVTCRLGSKIRGCLGGTYDVVATPDYSSYVLAIDR